MRFVTRVIVAMIIVLAIGASTYSHALTELSRLAGKLSMGMSRQAVTSLLGHADWIIGPNDRGEFALPPGITMELYWRNPGCTPVIGMTEDYCPQLVGQLLSGQRKRLWSWNMRFL